MTVLKQILRIILVIHGLLNIAQGIFCISFPFQFAEKAGPGFQPSSQQAIQSIGLGSVGVGFYGALGAFSNNRIFYVATVAMRLAFAATTYSQWGWEKNAGVVMYEFAVAIIAGIAALT